MEKIVLRNLQQQVGKNKDDIQALSEGIRIRGFGEDVPEDLKPGESWLKGTGPYELIVMTDGGQINLGQWPARGPQGIPGPKGEGAVLGDVSAETTTLEPGLNAYVDVSKDGENLTFRFEIPQGERGIQGLKGETGPKGDTGPQGPQGPQGEARAVSEIVGTLESASALPSPSTVPSYYAYLVGKENNYTVYAIVGGVWKDIGNFTPIPGPQGEKGESYGTFTKTVSNGNELGKVLSGLTANQSVVGAYATIGKKTVELIVISYTKAEMIYAWSTFADNPDVPTTATWQAVTSPDTDARFPVGDVYADSITLYIYDSNKSLMDKVAFLKLDDDGILPQSYIQRYLNPEDIAKDSATLKGQFGTGSFKLINGLVLDCFLVMGTTLCVGKMNGDAENNIYIDNITPLENGAIVSMADGNGHYKNYQVLENTTEAWRSNIWDMIYPISCRFELETYFPGDSYFQSMRNVDLKIKMTSNSNQRFAFYIRNIFNSSIYIDSSDYHPITDPASEAFQVYFLESNYGAISGLNMTSSDGRSANGIVNRLAIASSLLGSSLRFYPRINNYQPLNLTQVNGKPASNYWFNTLDMDEFNREGGTKAVQMDYRFEFSPSGSTTMEIIPNIVDYTPTIAPTMAKARAMSVEPMSLQTEPVQSEPIIPNVPEDAIGIFSVDTEGNTINAMTGERI